MTATILEFKARPNNDGVIDDMPDDSALCCENCMQHAWALRFDGKIECLECLSILNGGVWDMESGDGD